MITNFHANRYRAYCMCIRTAYNTYSIMITRENKNVISVFVCHHNIGFGRYFNARNCRSTFDRGFRPNKIVK